MHTAEALPPDIAALIRADLQGFPPTRTGRPAYVTRKRRPRDERPRIVGRFIPQTSVAIILDWDLCAGARDCLLLVLSMPRDGATVSGVWPASIATQFGVSPRTVHRWLSAIEAEGYWVSFPGRARGSRRLVLTSKATRFSQRRPADFKPRAEKPRKRPVPRVCAPSLTNSADMKERKKEAATFANGLYRPGLLSLADQKELLGNSASRPKAGHVTGAALAALRAGRQRYSP